jgi:hypothetical protein
MLPGMPGQTLAHHALWKLATDDFRCKERRSRNSVLFLELLPKALHKQGTHRSDLSWGECTISNDPMKVTGSSQNLGGSHGKETIAKASLRLTEIGKLVKLS